MGEAQQYDIFISYRREGGYDTAQLLYDRLTQMRYRVSFDLETLRGGKFNTQLYKRIEQCSDVLVVMSKDSLNLRENQEDDWFRLEIAHALKHKKNIVPVFLRDFKFPQKGELPEDIVDLVDYQGVTASQEHFDSVLKRICRNFKAKPRRRKWPVVAAIAASLLVGAGIGVWLKADKIFPYPFTTEQKKQVESLAANIMLVGTAYNDYLAADNDLLAAARLSVEAGSRTTFDEAALTYRYKLKNARDHFTSAYMATSDFAKRVNGMPVDYAGMQVFLEGLKQELEFAGDEVSSLERVCDPDYPCEKADRLRMLNHKQKDRKIRSDLFSVSVMGIFCNISPAALTDFKKVAGEWVHIRLLHDPWLRDEKEIERKLEALCNSLQAVVGEMQTILGNQNSALAGDTQKFRKDMAEIGVPSDQVEKMLAAERTLADIKTVLDTTNTIPERELALYRKQLIEAGLTEEQADSLVAKLRQLVDKKQAMLQTRKQLFDMQDELAKKHEEIRKKFAPRDDDDIGILWGKALRFMSVNMPEEAKRCADVLRRRNTPDFPPSAIDTAEAIILSKGALPFVDGVLVCSYEPPATSHAIFKIGDVITEVNGKPCHHFEDYSSKAGNTYTIYRRNAKGEFDKLTATMPENQPRVALVNLTEKGDGK